MTEKQPIRTVAVAGAGIVGLSAALAFARALPQARVQLLQTPPDAAALADRMPASLPAIRHFHRLVGIGEPALVRTAGVTYRLGTRFDEWSSETAWYHCFGRHGATISASPFHLQWIRLSAHSKALEYDCYAPAVALAKAGKFVHPVDDQSNLLNAHDYALRLGVERYRELLRQEATRARVTALEGAIEGLSLDASGFVESIRLADGREVQADLFVDCAGPAAPILSRLDDRIDDWSAYLPCDRLVVRDSSGEASDPIDHARATDDGYEFSIPMPARTVRGRLFCSALSKDRGGGGDLVVFTSGRRRESWVRNVVAFGDSAAVIDPLEGTNLYLAQNAIRRAVTLLPDRDMNPLVLAEFNRRTAAEADRVRDFVAAHFLLSKRRVGQFWQSINDPALPDSLSHTLEQFEERGRLPKFEEESFSDDSWLALLIGLGVRPKRIDPTVHRVDEGSASAMLERIAAACAALPARLPTYAAYLEQLQRG